MKRKSSEADFVQIDAKGVYYRDLNASIREALAQGATHLRLINVNGQRYIADALDRKVTIEVHGVPGNDLGVFMNGTTVTVYGNAQDAVSNTMNAGKIVVHGSAGDVLGYGMRGGKLFVRGNVGYRVGIHMKGYKKQVPVIIAGGRAGDFLGEYMAGGILIVLGLNSETGSPIARHGASSAVAGDYIGPGMHGGTIYLGDEVDPCRLGKEVGITPLQDEDHRLLKELLEEFCADLDLKRDEVLSRNFVKLTPQSHRPYGNLYSY
jgi:glutamate synthase domain-containing protein 3